MVLDEAPLAAPEKTEANKVPWKKAIPIYIALWCEAFNSSSIFAYVGFMVLDFGMSKSEEDTSFMYVLKSGFGKKDNALAALCPNTFLHASFIVISSVLFLHFRLTSS